MRNAKKHQRVSSLSILENVRVYQTVTHMLGAFAIQHRSHDISGTPQESIDVNLEILSMSTNL